MSSISVSEIMSKSLTGLDSDLLEYVISVVENMSLDERRNSSCLQELIAPFLIDSELVDEAGAESLCRSIAVSFGGSGYKSNLTSKVTDDKSDEPVLLGAPIRIIDSCYSQPQKATYGGAVMVDISYDDAKPTFSSNTLIDISSVPVTQKQLRKQRRENEQLQRVLRAEQRAEEIRREEMAAARMAAILASRKAGKNTSVGVKVERFSLPHPSGTGDILSDASLTLSPGRRYGLIGKNGAGKSTLMRALANYRLEGLLHLRILLVDQHVEGDEQTPLQVI